MPSSNQSDFDGYHKWLGIPKGKARSYYDILALSLDEEDHDVIRAAVEQRRHFVESKRGDGHDDVVAEILYQINEAEVTLLNEGLRREYDRRMALFEKRRKNRQIDPMSSSTRLQSRPGRTVGEDNGFVATFAGLVGVICVAFALMTWFSFKLPWTKPEGQPDPDPVAVEQPAEPFPQQVAQEPVVPQPALPQEPAIPVNNVPPSKEAAPNATVKPVKVDTGVRVVITLPTAGNATFKIGRTDKFPMKNAHGETVALAGFSNATTIEKGGDIHFVEWDFQQTTAVSDFKVVGGDVRFDNERGWLVVGGERGGHFSIPMVMELPIVISYDIDEMDAKALFESSLSCRYATGDSGYLPFRTKAETGLSGPFNVNASATMWRFQNGKKVELPFRWLIAERPVSLKEVNDIPFTLDKKELLSANHFRTSFNTEGTVPVALSRLSLSGHIIESETTSIVAQPSDEPQNGDATAKAVKAMQGEWRCIAAEELGIRLNNTEVKKLDRRAIFKGNNLTLIRTMDGKRGTYVGRIDIDATNGQFDFIGKGPGGGPKELMGIYELKGDTLKVCYRIKVNAEAVRPTGFKTDADKTNHCLFHTYKRSGG